MVRGKGSKLDAAAKAHAKTLAQAEAVGRVADRAHLEAEKMRNRIKYEEAHPEESTRINPEQARTGVLLILVSVIDTLFEWHLWTHAGGITMGILLLSRLALLLYGVQQLRHERRT